MTATVQPVARPRGDLTADDLQRLTDTQQQTAEAIATLDVAWRVLCVEMVKRSSFRAVSEATGISTNTLQRWKREAGK